MNPLLPSFVDLLWLLGALTHAGLAIAALARPARTDQPHRRLREVLVILGVPIAGPVLALMANRRTERPRVARR